MSRRIRHAYQAHYIRIGIEAARNQLRLGIIPRFIWGDRLTRRAIVHTLDRAGDKAPRTHSR